MKRVLLLLSLLLLLTSCGSEEGESATKNNPAPPAAADTKPQEVIMPEAGEVQPEEDLPVVDLPTEQIPVRTPEQESLDAKLIMLLREQLDGAYPVAGAEFTYLYDVEIEGAECFVYEMQNEGEYESFAVATDSTQIFHLEEEGYVPIFDLN